MQELRAGDWVEVRPWEEIRSTLDDSGAHEGLPFMPEMLRFCGHRFQVSKRAHKTCDTLYGLGALRVRGMAVHLDDLRCDGSAHGGCEASCLVFWKVAWLKRVVPSDGRSGSDNPRPLDTAASLHAEIPQEWSRQPTGGEQAPTVRWRCQATEAPTFTRPMSHWDVRQYLEDLTSRNMTIRGLLWGGFHSLFRTLLGLGVGYRVVERIYNQVQAWRGEPPNPYVSGQLSQTPSESLGLMPGDSVRVRSFESIMATLDTRNKNRGLWFVPEEMGRYCGREGRVVKRVSRIIDEKTGRMLEMRNPSVVIEGMYCTGSTVAKRMFCPRASALFWREIWLERVSADDPSGEPARLRD
jgi:hypothetical protein